MTTVKCPQCATVNSVDNEFCDNCGAQLPVQAGVGSVATPATPATPVAPVVVNTPVTASKDMVCPQCQAPLTPGDEFCFNCGHDVRNLAAPSNGSAAAVIAPVTPPAPPAGGMKDDDLERELAALKGQVGAPTPTPVVPAADPVTPPPVAATPDPTPAPPLSSGNGNAFGAPASSPTTNAFATAPLTTPTAVAPTTSGTQVMRLHVTGPFGEEMVEWKGQELLLGRRDPKTRVFPDVNLDDSAASRRHLSLWLESGDGKFYAQDLESANGTTLNGRDLRPGEPTEVHNNDILKIGTRYSIQVRIS